MNNSIQFISCLIEMLLVITTSNHLVFVTFYYSYESIIMKLLWKGLSLDKNIFKCVLQKILQMASQLFKKEASSLSLQVNLSGK